MSKGSTPKICLNMIVKNESKIIKRCLDSVIDIIDTWCIVDTGSTDGTQDIIKEVLKDKPGILHEKPWVNFGHNRNEALELGREWGDWILLTDADMILVNNGFDKSQLNLEIDVYDITQDNSGTVYNNMRLLNTKREWKCIGVTHEYYDCVDGVKSRDVLKTIWFNDVSDGGSKGDKFERDIRLLEQGLIDEPTNSRYMFYLAQSYRDIGNWDKAIEWYQKRYEAKDWEEERWFALYMIGYCMINRGDSWEDFYPTMMKAWMERPWRAEPVWALARYAREKNMWQHAYQLSKISATMPWPIHDVLFITKAAHGFSALDEFAVASYWVGQYDESLQAGIRLLQHPELPQSEIPRIKKNIWYTRKSLGHYTEKALDEFINEKRKQK